MKVEISQGISPSKVWCPRCNFGKILETSDTKGVVDEQEQVRLEGIAVRHEQRRPKHTDVTVFIYRQNKV